MRAHCGTSSAGVARLLCENGCIRQEAGHSFFEQWEMWHSSPESGVTAETSTQQDGAPTLGEQCCAANALTRPAWGVPPHSLHSSFDITAHALETIVLVFSATVGC